MQELSMRTFTPTSTVLLGVGFPARISGLMDAWRVLNDWPISQRGAAHAVALDACRRAFEDPSNLANAHQAFAGFAAGAGILVDDPMHLAAERVADEWFGLN